MNCLKTLTFSFLFLLLFKSANAQVPTPVAKEKRHEMAIDTTDLIRVNQFGFNPGLGLMYRYNFKNHAIRARFDGNRFSQKSKGIQNFQGQQGTNEFISEQEFGNSTFRLGYQYSTGIVLKKLNFYFGVDLMYTSTKNRNMGTNIFTQTTGWRNENSNTNSQSSTGIGPAPVMGLRYRFSETVSISLENSVSYLFTTQEFKNEQHSRQFDDNNVLINEQRNLSENIGSGTNFNFNPGQNLSVYFSFNF